MRNELNNELTPHELDRVSGGLGLSDFVPNDAELTALSPFGVAVGHAINDARDIYNTAKKLLS